MFDSGMNTGDDMNGKMTRMEINGGGSEGKPIYVSSHSYGDFLGLRKHWYNFTYRSKTDQIIVVTAVLVLVCIFVFLLSEYFSSPHVAYFAPPVLASDMRYMLHKSFLAAANEGSLVKSNVSSPEIMVANGIEFLVMTLRDPSFSSRAAWTSVDPFDRSQLSPSHIVTPIAPKHTLILNKYYTINDHSILISNSFNRQESLLTHEDIEAWFFCITSIKAIGFYNSNPSAGASQPHKHMQLIPMNEIRNLSPHSTYTLPVDMSIRSRIVRRDWKYFLPLSTDVDSDSLVDTLEGASHLNIYRIPEYQFKHAVIPLIAADEWAEVSEKTPHADYLVSSYRQLLWHLALISSPGSVTGVAAQGYNLLLTDRWMMLVCRQQEAYYSTTPVLGPLTRQGVSEASPSHDRRQGQVPEGGLEVASVNGLGFAGLLLARGPAALAVVREQSPLAVLRGVAAAD